MNLRRAITSISALIIASTTVAACTSTSAGRGDDKTVTVVAYDSFTPSKEVLAAFTKQTGIAVKVLTSGDTGELVNKAILTQDQPLGDVLYGVDNTFLSRAVGAGLFDPYQANGLDKIDERFSSLVPGHQVTPVDFGDVCMNYDKAALAKAGVQPPTSIEELATPQYAKLTVVENPATSSPGLAFLLATIAKLGDQGAGGWVQYWSTMRTNGVKVVAGWDQAWNTEFSGGPGKGARPIVLSYASSPPAAVLFGPDPKATETPIGVVEDTCFRQVEFVGLLRKARNPKAAQAFIDFTVGQQFQADLPLNMFVYPVRTGTTLPDVFQKFSLIAKAPLTVTPQRIAANRESWIDTWTATVLK